MSKRPLSALSVGATTRPGEGSVPEAAPTVVPTAAPPEPRTAMTYRPTVRTHDRLRKVSFDTRRSMQELVDEAVETWLAGQSR